MIALLGKISRSRSRLTPTWRTPCAAPAVFARAPTSAATSTASSTSAGPAGSTSTPSTCSATTSRWCATPGRRLATPTSPSAATTTPAAAVLSTRAPRPCPSSSPPTSTKSPEFRKSPHSEWNDEFKRFSYFLTFFRLPPSLPRINFQPGIIFLMGPKPSSPQRNFFYVSRIFNFNSLLFRAKQSLNNLRNCWENETTALRSRWKLPQWIQCWPS